MRSNAAKKSEMSPQAVTQGEESETRARLTKVAAIQFAQYGFDGISLQGICIAAGLSKGAIYHYFASKDELVAEIVASAFEGLLAVIRCDQSPEESASSRLRTFIVSQAVFFEKNEHEFRLAMMPNDWIKDEAQKSRIDRLRDEYVSILNRILREGMERGEFDSADRRTPARMALSFLYWLSRWGGHDSRIDPVAAAQDHADILLRGIGASPASPRKRSER